MDPKPATSSQFSSLFRQARCRTGDQLSGGVIGDPDDDGNEDDDIGHIKSFCAPGPGYDVEDEKSLCFAHHQNQSLNNICQSLESVILLLESPCSLVMFFTVAYPTLGPFDKHWTNNQFHEFTILVMEQVKNLIFKIIIRKL